MSQGVGAGIVRGCGRQKIGVVINFISYDLIGLPLGICLSFLVDEVRGVEGEETNSFMVLNECLTLNMV